MIQVLLLTGASSQYHDWTVTSAAIASRLRETGKFEVDVVDAPLWDQRLLTGADVVVIDYEGPRWPPTHERALGESVRDGRGLVIVHAADNAFPDWAEYQEMCGLGGWGGRTESSGPKVRWRDGRQVLDESPGVALHPARRDFTITTRAPEHPVMKGLPAAWRHADDELYSNLRGPAKRLEVLATGWADPETDAKATGEHEPVLMAILYGRGRVFHTTLGHVGPADGSRTTAIDCPGFVATLRRGTEWAARGVVTQPVPADFPPEA